MTSEEAVEMLYGDIIQRALDGGYFSMMLMWDRMRCREKLIGGRI